MYFTSKEKSAVITILASIMKADGVVDEREKSFMDNFFQKFAITIDEYTAAARMSKDDCRKVMEEMPEDKRNIVSKCFLDMVGIDGHVDLRELRELKGFIG